MEYAIGIDLGGTSIKYALVDKAGNSFFEGKLPSFASVSAAKVIEQLIKAVMLLKDEAAKQNWTVLGIGLGTPGIVDETNRIVLGGAENIIGWENIDVASLLEEQMKLPVVVGNDANLMGLGEAKYGAGRGCTHVVFLTVGTGIGGAVIIDGKLFNGYAMAVECMSEHFYYLGRGIAGFVNIFSPQRIVLGGGVTESGIFYLEKIREVVREHVIADCALNTEIVAASLGNKAGFIGAASLILK